MKEEMVPIYRVAVLGFEGYLTTRDREMAEDLAGIVNDATREVSVYVVLSEDDNPPLPFAPVLPRRYESGWEPTEVEERKSWLENHGFVTPFDVEEPPV